MSKKCAPLWREAHFQVKTYKAPQCRTTFGSCDVEKVHAVVVRSTFRSQNVQNTLMLVPLLEAETSKKCMPLLREAHFQVKMLKAPHVRTTFGRRFAWQAQGIVHRVESEQNVRVLSHLQKPWQAWDI